MIKDKILFLDIDGVLNDHGTAHYFHYLKHEESADSRVNEGNYKQILSEQWSNSSVGNLLEIIKETGCKIVISSTWRLGQELDDMKSWFAGFPVVQDSIIGKTKSIHVESEGRYHNVPRGLECSIWLSDHNYNTYWDKHKFAIVDDDSDMWPLMRNFFQTDTMDGLTNSVTQKIIKHLNIDDKEPNNG